MRVGETGGAHNQEVGYASHLLYISTETLCGLIANLLEVCERHGRLLIMRIWGIGIGTCLYVGDIPFILSVSTNHTKMSMLQDALMERQTCRIADLI